MARLAKRVSRGHHQWSRCQEWNRIRKRFTLCIDNFLEFVAVVIRMTFQLHFRSFAVTEHSRYEISQHIGVGKTKRSALVFWFCLDITIQTSAMSKRRCVQISASWSFFQMFKVIFCSHFLQSFSKTHCQPILTSNPSILQHASRFVTRCSWSKRAFVVLPLTAYRRCASSMIAPALRDAISTRRLSPLHRPCCKSCRSVITNVIL